MLSYIIKLLKALGANSKPSQIANSFCIGFILGVMPKNNLLWWLVFVFFMFVRINKAGYFIMMLLGAFISPYLDPTFHKIGEFVLTYEPLVPVYSKLLEIPFVGFTRFNNTIVCGSLVAEIIAYIPLDDRPVNTSRAIYLAESAGFNLLMPEKDLYQTKLDGQILQKIKKEDVQVPLSVTRNSLALRER